jgi:signal transduction histidine kinase
MSSFLAKLAATPLRWQFAALLVATQIAAQVMTLSLADGVSGLLGLGRVSFATDALSPFITTIGIAQNLGPAERPAVYAAALAADPRLSVQTLIPYTNVQTDAYSKEVRARMLGRLPDKLDGSLLILTAKPSGPLTSPFLVNAAYRIDAQSWLVFDAASGSSLRTIPIMVGTLTVMLLAVPLAMIAIWAGMALVSPMTALARGAERFSRNLDGPPITEEGPMEVRALAGTLNVMRDRIKKLVDDRSQMLAAISHDMRTPLTRLQLRIDNLNDAEDREAMSGEIRRINAMIDSGLTFLRTQRQHINLAKVDIAVLARTIADEMSDQGRAVVHTGAAHVIGYCDRELLRRAIENLASNAVDHGGGAELQVRYAGETVVVSVSDHGPGIPDAARSTVLEPFVKADPARREPGASVAGFGLGLSITKAIAELHGGRLLLEANEPAGLKASIILDLAADGAPLADASGDTQSTVSARRIAETIR